jgi:hypothetical protein
MVHMDVLVFLYYQIMEGLELNMLTFDAILMFLLLTLKAKRKENNIIYLLVCCNNIISIL